MKTLKELEYQKKYINELKSISISYLEGEDPKLIIFHAPTGAGKTLMLAESLSQISKSFEGAKEFAFVWISVNYLHQQSKEKLEKYFDKEKLLECININEIQNNLIEKNQVVFINWESLNKEGISIFMSDNEKDWNLSRVIENTKDEDREIILVIDESHRAAKTSKAKEIVKIINPKLTLEVSATPKEDVSNDHKVTVTLKEVIAEEMIKQEIQINPGLNRIESNEDIVRTALKKRKELKKYYEELKTNINPLLLIQIPRKKATDVRSPEEKIIDILEAEGITTAGGKLALWLAEKDKKINLDYLEKDDSDVDVLIFKEAIAQGWDCPRASILLLQREWNAENYVFNIQTLGRIMRMPEQKYYENHPQLNVGYVYTASDNFSIVEDLADDYVSSVQMIRENSIYKNIYLPSKFIRRKREKQRLSGIFKDCLFNAASELDINDKKINIGPVKFKKDVGVEGEVLSLDKIQTVSFKEKAEIVKDREEVGALYTAFIRSQTTGFSAARSTEIIKSSMRSLFKKLFNISDEDLISAVVLNPVNRSEFEELIVVAKHKYASLPEKEDIVTLSEGWQVPETVSIFDKFDETPIKKSILKPYFVKRDKNDRQMWSKPERLFIDELEKTDDDILWWFKNGDKESKYFGVAYKKEDNHFYGFYPDFIVKNKKQIIIVEIKDDRDFKNENLLKLNAGREYQNEYKGSEKLHFYIISPLDYFKFFSSLKNQNLEDFKSKYEENLLRYSQSRKIVSENQVEPNSEDKELLDMYEVELDKAIKNLNDKSTENDILKLNLEEAQATVISLKEALSHIPKKDEVSSTVGIPTPFNICILGEVADENLIYRKLREYFAKYGIETNKWDITFYNNAKLRNSDILNNLKRGQSKFNLIITGQIFHHAGEGNQSSNLLTELKKEKYLDHLVGSSPKDLLTANNIIEKLEEYFNKKKDSASN